MYKGNGKSKYENALYVNISQIIIFLKANYTNFAQNNHFDKS